MSWHNIIVGGIGLLMVYAFFTMDNSEEEVDVKPAAGYAKSKIPLGRLVTLSCQTCRKLKKHREIETSLYECTKCKRKIDLRVS